MENVIKLNKKDIKHINSLLKEGEKFKDIAEVFHVSTPTLKRFMIDNDLYKYSTNSRSVKISKSQFKTSGITFGEASNLKEVLIRESNNNNIKNENPDILEQLLIKGNTITDIANKYKCDRKVVRDTLKEYGLYEKYYNEKNRLITLKNNINTRPYNGRNISNKKEDNTIEKEIKNTNLEEKVNNKIENTTKLNNNLAAIKFLNKCIVDDVVRNYINKNIAKISLDAKLDDLSNTILDNIISNFTDEELKDKNIFTSIKECLNKSIDDLLS